jgi:hypothetical protein
MRRPHPWLLGLLFLLYAALSAGPAWVSMTGAKHARDFATYHYAAQAVVAGGDPYDTRDLSRRARAEGTRKRVHPYFYPPPFVLSMLWSPAFSLAQSAKIFFVLNQLAWAGLIIVFRRWFKAPWLVIVLLCLGFTPLTDNAKMGQANLLVMLAAVAGLWRGSGLLLGSAAMAKMSPALYLVGFAAQRTWRTVLGAVALAIGSSVLALPFVDFDTQYRFYTEILPAFSTGDYHGLTVPITLPANHSIPDMFNQLWPGPDKHTLAPMAATASRWLSMGLLAILTLVSRHRRDALGQAGLFGAFTVLMLIIPVYTYEHHLAMAVFPAAVVGTALLEGRLGRTGWWIGLPSLFFVAWPLYMLRPLQRMIPVLHWWLQESKFFGLVGLALLCVFTALNSPRRD